MNEVRRKIGPDITLTLRGDGINQRDAVVAEILIELAVTAGEKLVLSDDVVEKIEQRLRQKGIDPATGAWLC